MARCGLRLAWRYAKRELVQRANIDVVFPIPKQFRRSQTSLNTERRLRPRGHLKRVVRHLRITLIVSIAFPLLTAGCHRSDPAPQKRATPKPRTPTQTRPVAELRKVHVSGLLQDCYIDSFTPKDSTERRPRILLWIKDDAGADRFLQDDNPTTTEVLRARKLQRGRHYTFPDSLIEAS